jgi:hypothetical protein
MGPMMPLEALYTAAPQDDREDDLATRPDVAEMIGEPGEATLAPGLEPQAFDAAILAGLVTP